jgi:hypothetical protein
LHTALERWITCVGEEKEAELKVPKERKEVVKQIYQWSDDGLTAPVIARMLREKGVDTYRERTKDPRKNNLDKPVKIA